MRRPPLSAKWTSIALLSLALSPLFMPISSTLAHCRDTGDCIGGPARPAPTIPTSVPLAEPTDAPGIGVNDVLPTDDLPRNEDYGLIFVGPLWNPTGFMTLTRSYQEWEEIDAWVNSEPDYHAKYNQAVRDRTDLWNYYSNGGYAAPTADAQQSVDAPQGDDQQDQPQTEAGICQTEKDSVTTTQQELDQAEAAEEEARTNQQNAEAHVEQVTTELNRKNASLDKAEQDLTNLEIQRDNAKVQLAAAEQHPSVGNVSYWQQQVATLSSQIEAQNRLIDGLEIAIDEYSARVVEPAEQAADAADQALEKAIDTVESIKRELEDAKKALDSCIAAHSGA